MKFKATLYIFILSVLGWSTGAMAQCHVKKTKNGKVIVAENPEYYAYNRTDSTYHGISIRALYNNQSGVKKYELIILYTSSANDTAKVITFKGTDGTSVQANMALLGLKKNDNKKQHTKVYQAALTDEQINYITSHKTETVSIINNISNSTTILNIAEQSFLADQLSCLINN